MDDQSKAALHLVAINGELLGLFEDYCHRVASPDLVNILQEYRNHRINLVLTVHASMTGADFICCATQVSGEPLDLIQLFTVHTIPMTQAGKAH